MRGYSTPAGGVTTTSSTAIPGRATIETRNPATSAGFIIFVRIEARAVIPNRRVGGAREERRDPDVERPRLGGQHAHEAELPGLRRGIRRAVGEPVVGRVRADHDDVTAPARLHPPERLARARERAGHVDLEHLAQIAARRVDHRSERAGAGRAHEDVELRQRADPLGDLGLVGDVEVRERDLAEGGDRDRRAAVRATLAEPPATRQHRGALVGERAGAGRADAARAPGHEGILAEQSLHAFDRITR